VKKSILMILAVLLLASPAFGLITYSDNFDARTIGQLPPGWINIGTANWQVGAVNPVSPPNALVDTTHTDGDVVLYTGSTPVADMTVTFDQILTAFNGSTDMSGVGVILRSDSSNNNCYTIIMSPRASAGIDLEIFKKVSGTYTELTDQTVYDSYVQGDIIHLKADATGSAVSIKIWKNNETEPGSWTLSATDSSITAPGYAGFYGTQSGSANSEQSFDNFNLSIAVSCSVSGLSSISLTDPNVIWSPYNWNITAGSATSNAGGAYFRFGFTGTQLAVMFDTSALINAGTASDHYPIVRYSVDNGTLADYQISSGQPCIQQQGLASGTHTLELFYNAGWWSGLGNPPDMWNTPVEAVVVHGFYIDNGSSSSAVARLSKKLLWFGDSISQGQAVTYSLTNPANNSSYDTVPVYVARALGAELGNVSYGDQGYETKGSGNVPTWPNAYPYYYNGASRLISGNFSPVPDYVAIWHGTNGTVVPSDVQWAITDIRAASNSSTKIFVIVPAGGFNRTPITAGFNNYASANPHDKNAYLIDLGTSWQTGLTTIGGGPSQQSIDSLHPDVSWNARLGAAYAQAIQSKLASAPNSPGLCNTPPTISAVAVNPSALWPPNHKMTDVTLDYNASGNCGQVSCQISSVTSNEPINSADYAVINAHDVQLNADRSGSGNGRIYTATITCTDTSGNSSSQTATAKVPHDQGGN
jgi:hypothetical protein